MISVVIPTYNAGMTIARTLDSINNQVGDYSFEVIIVNDGSTDNTLTIINDYIIRNPSMKIHVISQKNKGVAEARNVGLSNATGNFIAFIDADDEWHNDKTLIQMRYLNSHEDVGLIGSSTNSFAIKSTIFKKIFTESEISFKDQLLRNYFQPSTVIFRKDCLMKVGLFPNNQRYAEEGMFFFKFTHFYKCVLINKCLVNYGNGKGGFGVSGLSSNLVKMHEGEMRNLKAIRNLGWISFGSYFSLVIYTKIKYLRRKILSYVVSLQL